MEDSINDEQKIIKVVPIQSFRIDEVDNRIDRIEQKIDFMLKRVKKIVAEEIKTILDDEGFKDFLVETTKNYVHSKMDVIIKTVVEETVQRLNKNIKAELDITKSLCYSIDTEIKHVIRNMDLSYESDKFIEKKINEHINNFFVDSDRINKFMLEYENKDSDGDKSNEKSNS